MQHVIGVIDIGSNSIRTMTAERTDGSFGFSVKTIHTTRLAQGLSETGLLSEASMAHSLAVIRAFAQSMHASGVPVYAYATSAVRDAANRAIFADAVNALPGCHLEILSGVEEARTAFLAATGGSGGMLDIGGGSFQLVTSALAESFPMGCVRAKDLCPGETLDAISVQLNPRLDALFSANGIAADIWTGVGGTITTLAAIHAGCDVYDPARIQNAVITLDALAQTLRMLEALGGARRTLPLLEKRHDVILHGGAILLYLMQRLNIDALRVSDADGLEGYAMQMLNRM